MAVEHEIDLAEIAATGPDKPAAPAAPAVKWDDSQMTTSYANVVNAASTREEVTLFFGTNQTWNPTGQTGFEVRLSDRIVLNPYAAKRLWTLMGAVLQEHEKRFGALDLGAGAPVATSTTATPAAPIGNGAGKK